MVSEKDIEKITELATNLFTAQEIASDMRQRQIEGTSLLDTEKMYQSAIKLCLHENKHRVIPELIRVRRGHDVNGHNVTFDDLYQIEGFFMGLSEDYLKKVDEFLQPLKETFS